MKMKIDQTPPRISKRGRGFALIVALALMSFIFLLILSLSALIRVESRVTATQAEIQNARQNALFGLKVAIGQIQEMAGPDQRVTAAADILNGTASEEQKRWTGVWDVSSVDMHDTFRAPDVMGWLISGVDSSGAALTPGAAIPDEDKLVIVGEGSVTNSDDYVEVGRVPIATAGDNTVIGHYGYWVSDEGLKAKVNLTDPHRAGTSGGDEETRYSFLNAQRSGIENLKLSEDDSTVLGDEVDPLNVDTESKLKRMTSLNQLGNVSTALDTVAKNRFHDLTTYGYGLFTNTAQGGLRKDLSLAFEMDIDDFDGNNTFANYEDPVSSIGGPKVNYLFKFEDFSDGGPSISNAIARGPTWHLLRNYYRLYKEDDPDLSLGYKPGNFKGVESNGSGYKIAARPYFPIDYGKKNQGNITESGYRPSFDPVVNTYYEYKGATFDYNRETDMSIAPILLRVQAFVSVYTVRVAGEDTPDTADDDKYRIQLEISPVITIWNPYNVALEFEEVEVRFRSLRIGLSAVISKDGSVVDEFSTSLAKLGDASATVGALNLTLKSASGNTVMEPGEITVYTLQNVTGTTNEMEGECYPYSQPVQVEQGFVFDEIKLNDGGTNEEAIADYGADVAFEVKSTSFAVVDLRLNSNGNQRTINIGRMWVSTDLGAFDWPGGGTGDKRFVESLGLDDGPGKHPVGVIDLYQKPGDDNEPVQFLSLYNPRATTFMRVTGEDKRTGGVEPGRPANWDFTLKAFETDSWDTGDIAVSGGSSGYWGSSNQTGGENRVVLYDIPTLPMQSLAGFQHVNNITHYSQQPGSPLGNSYASPYIPMTDISNSISSGGDTYTQIDWSYIGNEALWDEYFFSTLAPRLDLDLDESDWNEIVTDFAKGDTSLPNGRIKLLPTVNPDDFVATVLGATDGDAVAADAYAEVAKDLMLDGAFNVNSTSVEAWKALLSATNKATVTYLNSSGGSTRTLSNQKNPYSRTSLPADRDNEYWTGFRALTDREIDDLANEIVNQIKVRGPFVSIADFVNRRLSNNVNGRKGALQAAIDATDINDEFSGNNVTPSDLNKYGLPNVLPAVGPIESGATGYLRQADLLQVIGQVVAVRSDTFLIRAYGDSVNPVNNSTVRAWCEAVVQRVPDYVDASNDAVDVGSALNSTNDKLGRRFEIVSFRWLSKNEI